MGRPLERLREATRGTEWEGRLWLVGGAVRDRLLGRPTPNDLDLVMEASALEFADWCWRSGISQIQPVTYPRFGTAMVMIEGSTVELVTARSESYRADSRKPEVRPATLLEDARRRDFTVNALYENLHGGALADPLGMGVEDLNRRILRTPIVAEDTFEEDPLRMLRAVRFRWQIGLDQADGLWDAIRAKRHRLAIVSRERIRDELCRMLDLADAARCLDDLLETGLLEQFAPELASMKGVSQGGYHHLDVWDHTMLAVSNLGPGDLVASLGVLLHDVGKPQTRSVEADGRVRFLGHEKVGAEIAERWLREMRFPSAVATQVATIVRGHMRLMASEELTDSALRRLVRDFGPLLERLLRVVEADALALRPGVRRIDVRAIRQRIDLLSRQTPPAVLESPLSGREIMELTGWSEGPQVGKAKAWLLERVLDGSLPPADAESARAALLQAIDRGELP